MMRRWPIVASLFVGLCLGFALDNLGRLRELQAKDDRAAPEQQIAALKAEIQAIQDRLPDQAHAMQDVANQFTNVWFAEGKRHWELTKFYLGETRNHLRWAVRIIPKRKDNAGREVDLVSILQAMENGPWKQLETAIRSKDHNQFVATYRFTLETCYACHKASDKPYLRPQIPTGPATQVINFDPNATWPR